MLVRNAEISDYDEIVRLYNLFVGEARYSDHKHDSFNKVLENPNNFVFIVEDEKKLIGFASFSVRDVIRYPKPIAELDEFFILEEFRNRGVGRRLMEEVEEKAKELHCHRLSIETGYAHKDAHAFYEQIGYTNYGYHFMKDLK
jgi:PhnO protein